MRRLVRVLALMESVSFAGVLGADWQRSGAVLGTDGLPQPSY